jgi:peptidoglycan/LPS O-acetylase OafA/YrhL
VFFAEFFSGITVEGISALPLALLPLFALDGAALFAWKKWVWAIGYAVGLAAFMLVLLTIPSAWGEVQGDFLRWVLLFVAFAVFAVAVWGVNALLERRKKAAPATEAPPPAPAG